jgi:vancomycin permeability regulator SanA
MLGGSFAIRSVVQIGNVSLILSIDQVHSILISRKLYLTVILPCYFLLLLYPSKSNIAYTNRVMAKALHLFREGRMKKLIDRGSNSTTRSYNITGIKPRNLYSSGWRENLELYASFNGL